ncbi:MAG: metallophosphoesterase family protein [Lachnospiraceae bacterium]|nr:metallophosphoesterase family protein [Lachnospiraceae bacterium]
MKRVAILSDTHDILLPEVIQAIDGVDMILHAGDVCDETIMDQLRVLAPVMVVRGNNDFGWASSLSKSMFFQIEQVRFYMIHDRSYIMDSVNSVDVVIYGHTHRYTEEMRGNTLWFNPGSAGWARYNNELSFAIMTIDGDTYTIEKHVLRQERRKRFFW